MHLTIPNNQNERLDVLIEGNIQCDSLVLFVHGFGTDKHETGGLFDDIALSLGREHMTVRFDFSGYGKSEGKQEESTYRKQADDLHSIIAYAREYKKRLSILAFSMGCFSTCLLSPEGIDKTMLVSIPGSDIKNVKTRLINKIRSLPEGMVDESGISLYPRSGGGITRIGPNFWKELDNFRPVESVSEYSKKTRLGIIHPLQDVIVGEKGMSNYTHITTLEYMNLSGDHAFTNPSDREILVERITLFFHN